MAGLTSNEADWKCSVLLFNAISINSRKKLIVCIGRFPGLRAKSTHGPAPVEIGPMSTSDAIVTRQKLQGAGYSNVRAQRHLTSFAGVCFLGMRIAAFGLRRRVDTLTAGCGRSLLWRTRAPAPVRPSWCRRGT